MRFVQQGPPDSLQRLANVVARTTYRPGWTIELAPELNRGQGCGGATVVISATVPDSFDPAKDVGIAHLMPVPIAAYDEETWALWLWQQIALVERHESLEWFEVDGRKTLFPSHAPGRDPYAPVVTHDPDAFAPAVPWHGGQMDSSDLDA